ncbi:MAG: RNA polymerase sigma factor [Mucilaginibacter sp.]
MDTQQQTITTSHQQGLLNLYDKYASLLLGYIYEIVKDHELAEQYLISTFKHIADQYHDIVSAQNIWSKLQQIAKRTLAEFFVSIKDCDSTAVSTKNSLQIKVISKMTEEQRTVFCGVYYHGKTTAALAKQLSKPELTIRKTLKEAFAIIRQGREHTGIH